MCVYVCESELYNCVTVREREREKKRGGYSIIAARAEDKMYLVAKGDRLLPMCEVFLFPQSNLSPESPW